MENPAIGDWVRFQQQGRLVIGVVNYIRPRASWERADIVVTDLGEVSADRVLEARKNMQKGDQ